MCFYMPMGKDRYAKLATRNIPCWKNVKRGGFKSWISIHFAFIYNNGYEYENDNFNRDGARYKTFARNYRGTNQGLHSFTSKPRGKNYFQQVVIKCYIPKGAYYFKNGGFYFSNRLVVEGIAK